MASLQGVRAVEVILTAGCNLACSYCYQNDKQQKRMSWPTLQAAIDLLLNSTQPDRRLLFIGGEPLSEAALIRRAVQYIDDCGPSHGEIGYSISTNGLLLDDEMVDLLASHRFTTQISFDGVPAAQNERGAGSFSRLDKLIDRLRKRDFGFFRDLTLAITLVADTVPYLADSIAYFLTKDVRKITIGPRMTHDPGWCSTRFDELQSQFDRILELSVNHYQRTGLVPLDVLRRQTDKSPHAPRGRQLCGVGSGGTIAIDVDGQVSGCVTFATSYQKLPPFLAERFATMAMGDFRSEDFPRRLAMYPAAARAAEIFDRKQDKYSSYGRCGECRHLAECSVCPTSIGHIPGNDDPRRIPDLVCGFNLISLDARDRFPRQPSAAELLTGAAPIPELMLELQRAMLDRPTAPSG